MTAHANGQGKLVQNSSSEQLHRNIDVTDNRQRTQISQQRNMREIVDPNVNVPRKSYRELQAELLKSNIHVSSPGVDAVEEINTPLIEEDDIGNEDLNYVSTEHHDVPNIVVSSEVTEISEQGTTTEATIVTVVHKQVSDVADDQVSVSLEHDILEKDTRTSTESHEQDGSDLQVISND